MQHSTCTCTQVAAQCSPGVEAVPASAANLVVLGPLGKKENEKAKSSDDKQLIRQRAEKRREVKEIKALGPCKESGNLASRRPRNMTSVPQSSIKLKRLLTNRANVRRTQCQIYDMRDHGSHPKLDPHSHPARLSDWVLARRLTRWLLATTTTVATQDKEKTAHGMALHLTWDRPPFAASMEKIDV